MKRVYAPGCALMIDRPHLATRLLAHLNEGGEPVPLHLTCCHHDPHVEHGTEIVNTCPGCDRRFRELYAGVTTVSLWELLARSSTFPFPDYHGAEMAIQDACPTRTEDRVHAAVRQLLNRMNVRVVEPRDTRGHSICCGDSSYDVVPVDAVLRQMQARAAQMPREDVVVYCVSCIKAMHIGGRRPRYLVDLLFGEPTTTGTFEPAAWHAQVQAFIDAH